MAEDLEDGEVAAEGHGDAFGAAFFVGGSCGAEDGGVGLGGEVVGGDWEVGYGAEGRGGVGEVVGCGAGLLEEFSGAVAEEFVAGDGG